MDTVGCVHSKRDLSNLPVICTFHLILSRLTFMGSTKESKKERREEKNEKKGMISESKDGMNIHYSLPPTKTHISLRKKR